MILKRKLSWGLGFLFLIIFTLVGFCSYYVGSLGRDADNILKDNYHSIVYAQNMFSGLDDMKTSVSSMTYHATRGERISDYYRKLFESGKTTFETNLKAENGNITEIHEKEFVERLNRDYEVFLKLCLQMKNGQGSSISYFSDFLPAAEKLKQSVTSIYDVNMEAVVRKSGQANHDAASFTKFMAMIGSICILLALGYFWYFPVYISTTLSYLADRMKALLTGAGFTFDVKTDDEAFIILQAINLLENKLGKAKEDKPEKVERTAGTFFMGSHAKSMKDRMQTDHHYQEAIDTCLEALAVDPHNGKAYRRLGDLYFEIGGMERAADSYRKALQFGPGHEEIHNGLGMALIETGRTQEALGHFRRAVEANPSYGEAYFNQANALRSMGLEDEALPLYIKSIELKPDIPQAYYHAANIFRKKGRLDDAIRYYGEAIRLDPHYRDALNHLALAFREKRMHASAAQCYELLLMLEPDSVACLNNYAIILSELGRLPEAMDALKKAAELDPSDSSIAFNLGKLLEETGRIEEGVSHYLRAVHAEKGNARPSLYDRATLDYPSWKKRFGSLNGFLYDFEGYTLMMLAHEGAANGEVVEIGSFMGRSTCWLASGVKDRGKGRVTAIDTFKGSPEHQRHETIQQQGSTFDAFLQNLKQAGLSDYVTPVIAPSLEAVRGWEKPIRLLFIDGDHSYEASKADFESWESHVVPGGLVCFHDIGVWDGVTRFYGEMMNANRAYRQILSVMSLKVIEKRADTR